MFWRGVIGYLPANLVQGLVGLLSIVLFTRLMSPEAYGVYALAFSLTTLVHTLVFTWLEAAMARFWARESEAGGLPDHFATLLRLYMVLALGVLGVAAIALWLVPLSAPLRLAVGAGLFATPIRSLARLAQEHRRAAGQVRASSLLDISQTGGAFLIGAALAAMGAGGAAPLIGAGVAAILCLTFVLPGEVRQADTGRFQAGRAGDYAHYGVPVAMSLILSLALATTDRFMLAVFLDPASVGVYHAGYSLSNRTLDVLFIWLGAAGRHSSTISDACSRAERASASRPPRSRAATAAGPPAAPSQMNRTSSVRFERL